MLSFMYNRYIDEDVKFKEYKNCSVLITVFNNSHE